MRVAIFSGTIPSTTFIERLVLGLAEEGVEIILHGKIIGEVRYQSKNVKKVGYAGGLHRIWLAFKFGSLFSLTRPGALIKLIKCYPRSIFSGSFLNWFVRTGPIVWHKPDIFHLQWARGIGDWIFLQEFGIKVIVSLRGAQINCAPIADSSLADTYRRLFREVEGFHSVSRATCLEAAKYGSDPEKCTTIYSGLDLEQFPFSHVKLKKKHKTNIISVGRPTWKKGYHFGLDAMKILSGLDVSFHYTIVGGISEEMVFQVQDLGLNDQVTLLKTMPFENVEALIAGSDILLLPSVEEGMPNVVLEAMALGTVVVSTRCGGVPEVVNDGENGFLVPVRDAEAMAAKIKSVCDLSAEDLNKVRRKARKTIERQHDQQKMADAMKGFYRTVAANGTQLDAYVDRSLNPFTAAEETTNEKYR